MDFVHMLSDDEIKDMNNDLVKWLKKALVGKYGTYIYNIVHSVKSLYEEIERNEQHK